MKSSGIGGQAVLEGVMMKNRDVYSIAVRKPDQTIEVKNEEYQSIQKKYPFTKLPIIRGIVSFAESMVIGMKTLTYSASFYEEEDVQPTKVEETLGKIFKEKTESVVMGTTVVFSVILAVAVFMILPFFVAEIFKKITMNGTVLALIEGLIRITIFIAYVVAISYMKDIHRVFMYHGAEHKTINCVESGLPLTIQNVRGQSKSHKRCGTSFLFIVMFISIIFFLFIRVDNLWLRMIYRILLVPVIAGVSYEFIRLAGSSESSVVNVLSKPGLWLQALTTREPDDSMIEVAIASVDAVFDWKKYQEEATKDKAETVQDAEKTKKAEPTQKTEKTKNIENAAKAAISHAGSETTASKERKITAKERAKAIEPFSAGTSILDEEEEDEILSALDKYFVFGEEKKEP